MFIFMIYLAVVIFVFSKIINFLNESYRVLHNKILDFIVSETVLYGTQPAPWQMSSVFKVDWEMLFALFITLKS